MSKTLVVGISDYKFSRNPDILVTYALGSCVGICLFDKRIQVGGLAHIMLPDSKMFSKTDINRMKFADTAIPDLLQQLQKLGIDRNRISAKIAGGAQMFEVQQGSSIGTIGERNVGSVKQVLNALKIPVIAQDTGLNYGRTVYFNLSTGTMKVQSLNRSVKEF